MILTFAFALLICATILCLALDRFVATRWLAVGVAAALLVAAGTLLNARSSEALSFINQPRLTLEQQSVVLALGFDAASWPFALFAMVGGALACVALGLALPATLRGYGGLVAATTLLFVAVLFGLALQEQLLLPVAWAMMPLIGFIVLRASGGQSEQALPVGLFAHFLGAIIVLGALLSAESAVPGETPWVVPLGILIGTLLALGLPPFHRAVFDLALGPAAVAAPLLACGLPLFGAFVLIHFVAATPLTEPWRLAFQLIGLGSLWVCSAAALRERRLRQIVGWLMSAQFGLLLLALGLLPAALATIAPALASNIVLSTLVALLAIGLIERHTGTDHLDEIRLHTPLMLPGAALLIAALSTVGLPGTWGFWPLRWLVGELAASPLLGPLFGGAALMGLAWVSPVVACFRTPKETNTSTPANVLAQLCPIIGALPLVAFGLFPGWAWNTWGAAVRLALLPQIPQGLVDPVLPGAIESSIGFLALLLVLGLVLGLRQRIRRTFVDAEVAPSGVITPDALGESLNGMAWIGMPSATWARLWQAVSALSQGLNWGLRFFEQRYFMAGLMLAVVAVLLLLMQG